MAVEFEGPYKPDFKAHMEQHYVVTDPASGKPQKLLQFQNLLYVLFEGKV